MSEKLKGQLRHWLGAGVGYAVGKGWISETFGTEAVGILMLAIPLVWSWIAKSPAKEVDPDA